MNILFHIVIYSLLLFTLNYKGYSQASSFDDAGSKFLDAIIKNDIDIIKSMQATPDIYRIVAPSQMKDLSDEEIMSLVNDNQYSMHSKFKYIVKDLDIADIDKSKLRFTKAKEKKYELLKIDWKPVEVYFDYLGTKDTILIELYKKGTQWFLIDIANDDKEFFNIISTIGHDRAKAYYDAGISSKNERDFYTASHFFEIATRLDTTYYEAWFENGFALIELRDFVKAELSLNKSLINDKSGQYHSSIYLELGYLAKEQNDLSKAELYFNKSIGADSNQYYSYFYISSIAYGQANYPKAIEYLKKAIQNNIEEQYYAHYLLGMSYFNIKEYEKSSVAFIDALERNPYDIKSLYQLGWIYNELKEFSMAVTVYDALLRIEKNNYDAMYELAYAYLNMENFVSALELFSKVEAAVQSKLITTINYARLCRHLGNCYLAFNEKDKACKYFKQAQEGNEQVNPELFKKACTK